MWKDKLNHVTTYVRRNGVGYTCIRAGQMVRDKWGRAYDRWYRAAMAPTPQELAAQRGRAFAGQPLVSLVVPVYNTPPVYLRALIQSFLAQTYAHWEACLYDGASDRADTRAELAAVSALDSRVRVERGERNDGIAGNSNHALDMARGAYILLVDHDDLLTPDALYWVMDAAETQGAEMIYSDEDKVDEKGGFYFGAHFKPDFSPDHLNNGNYICHLTALKASLAREIGGFRTGFDGSQDHDLVLRASEHTSRIAHIPRPLYHWRMFSGSMSHQKLEQCVEASRQAVLEHLARCGTAAEITRENGGKHFRLHYPVPEGATITLILLDDGGAERLKRCLAALEAHHWGGREACLVSRSNGKMAPSDWKTLEWPEGEGRFQAANRAAAQARGDYLLFLDAGVAPEAEGWWRELLMYAARRDVGAVSSVIYDRRSQIVCAGYAVGTDQLASPRHKGLPRAAFSPLGLEHLVMDVAALPAALMMTSQAAFRALGGFDAAYAWDLGDVDYGLRGLKAGLLNVCTPYAKAAYRPKGDGREALLTGLPAEGDAAIFRKRWGERPYDPYYNPNYTRRDASFALNQRLRRKGSACNPAAK